MSGRDGDAGASFEEDIALGLEERPKAIKPPSGKVKEAPAPLKKGRIVSLRLTLGGAFIFAVLATAIFLGTVTFLSVRTQLRQNLGQRLMDLAAIAVVGIDTERHATLTKAADMEGEAYQELRQRLQRIRGVNPDIKYVYTFRKASPSELTFILDTGTSGEDFSPLGEAYTDLTPQLIASFDPPYKPRVDDTFYPDEFGIWLSGYAPILRADGSLEAVLGIDISAAQVVAYETKYLIIIVIACIGVSLAGAAVGLLFSRQISRPLLEISADMKKVQRFEVDEAKALTSSITEVMVMDAALRDMKKGLRSFKRYVPADVVVSLMRMRKEAVLETRLVHMTFFFSDLENFTTLSEQVGNEDLSEFLDDYFGAMTRALQANGATVDKFIGDAIMAFWNAPGEVKHHEFKACRAALDCQAALGEVWERWRKRGFPTMRTRMGIHSGEAHVGNIGFAERLSYTAIGETVNTASRIEGLNKFYDTRVLVSSATVDALRGAMTCRFVDKVIVKGSRTAITVHELLFEGKPQEEPAAYLKSWEAACDLYRRQRWEEAAMQFARILKRRPTDGPGKILHARCVEFTRNPPPSDWDGATLMQEK